MLADGLYSCASWPDCALKNYMHQFDHRVRRQLGSSAMDKGDYSEVKELITSNSNCATNSPFDGDSLAFYGSAKDDSFQKVCHTRQLHSIFSLIYASSLSSNFNDMKPALSTCLFDSFLRVVIFEVSEKMGSRMVQTDMN